MMTNFYMRVPLFFLRGLFFRVYFACRACSTTSMEFFMATKPNVTPAEKQVIADSLDLYVKSLERAERAAKDAAIAAAYRDAAGKVRSLSSRIMSGELEL